MLELANSAASENSTRFGTFHLYEESDDEEHDGVSVEYKQEPRHVFELALMCGGLIGLRCTPNSSEELKGFVVGLGAGWLLIHKADDWAYLDGYAAIPVADIFDAWTIDPHATVTERALRLRGEHPQPLPELDPDTARSVLEYADASFPLVTVYVEREIPDVCYVGRVKQFDDDDFTLETITPGARWEDEERFAYDAVTRIEFGGRYEDALALVAASETD